MADSGESVVPEMAKGFSCLVAGVVGLLLMIAAGYVVIMWLCNQTS